MSEIQQKYLDWHKAETEKGLKSVTLFPASDLEGVTVDSILEELMAVDEAVKQGRYTLINWVDYI